MNERKIEENLMVGDLVYYSYPNQFVAKVIDICSHGEEPFIRCQRDPKDKLYVPGKFEDFHVDILSSIELTEEILKKNGFKNDVLAEKSIIAKGASNFSVVLISEDNRITLNNIDEYLNSFNNWHIHIDTEDMRTMCTAEITYVHELQHLLKLCKIEKKIVL